jgi:hypothetical protein
MLRKAMGEALLPAFLPIAMVERVGRRGQFLVECPDRKSRQDSGSKQMDVNVVQSFPHEVVAFYEREYLFVLYQNSYTMHICQGVFVDGRGQ